MQVNLMKIISKSKIKSICKLSSNKSKLSSTAGVATKEQFIKIIKSKYNKRCYLIEATYKLKTHVPRTPFSRLHSPKVLNTN